MTLCGIAFVSHNAWGPDEAIENMDVCHVIKYRLRHCTTNYHDVHLMQRQVVAECHGKSQMPIYAEMKAKKNSGEKQVFRLRW